MVRMIREYFERTGIEIGFKPAGGVSTAKSVLEYQISSARPIVSLHTLVPQPFSPSRW
jgi:deoxyribose-phosphate aldolase